MHQGQISVWVSLKILCQVLSYPLIYEMAERERTFQRPILEGNRFYLWNQLLPHNSLHSNLFSN